MSNGSSTLRERTASPLMWHYLGLAALAVLVIGLAVRLGFDLNGSSAETLASKEVRLKALNLQTAPLRGLDHRVAESRDQMQAFYDKRIPANYSSIASTLGELEVKSGVRLTRVLYAQGARDGDLTEISMDAGVSGAYPQIMRFVNGLERSQTFFVVRAMTLTGQQGGMVNLRLRLSTWLRAADAATTPLPPAAPGAAAAPAGPAPAAAAGKEGE